MSDLLKYEPDEKSKRKVSKVQVYKRYEPRQEYLLPLSTEDFISSNHIARLVDHIVESINLDFIYNRYIGGGTSAYHPKMLLKVWLLGHIMKIYSSRGLSQALRENLAFMWLSGMTEVDHRTLNNFRIRLKKEIKFVFKEVVQLGLEVGIISGKNIFLDHTKIEADANSHKIVWRKTVERRIKNIDAELDILFEYVDELNLSEDRQYGEESDIKIESSKLKSVELSNAIEKINEKLQAGELNKNEAKEAKTKIKRVGTLLERKEKYERQEEILSGRNSYSTVDTDATGMKMKRSEDIKPAYNEGIVTENSFVLGTCAIQNAADNTGFKDLVETTIDNLNMTPASITTDGAYGSCENLEYLKEKGITSYAKYNGFERENKKLKKGELYRKEHFQYDTEKDIFICPNEKILEFSNERQEIKKSGYVENTKVYKAKEEECKECPLMKNCTKGKCRSLQVNAKLEDLKKETGSNLRSEKGIMLSKRRSGEVERVFAERKKNHGIRRYLLRGLEKVNLEATLFYTAYNIKRIYFYLKEKWELLKKSYTINMHTN